MYLPVRELPFRLKIRRRLQSQLPGCFLTVRGKWHSQGSGSHVSCRAHHVHVRFLSAEDKRCNHHSYGNFWSFRCRFINSTILGVLYGCSIPRYCLFLFSGGSRFAFYRACGKCGIPGNCISDSVHSGVHFTKLISFYSKKRKLYI